MIRSVGNVYPIAAQKSAQLAKCSLEIFDFYTFLMWRTQKSCDGVLFKIPLRLSIADNYASWRR